jgi:hypothetical protein
MPESKTYVYLTPRAGSRYQQYFFTGRNLRAETLCRATLGLEPMAAEEVADDYNVPIEAVLESIQYSLDHADLLQTERGEDARTTGVIWS